MGESIQIYRQNKNSLESATGLAVLCTEDNDTNTEFDEDDDAT